MLCGMEQEQSPHGTCGEEMMNRTYDGKYIKCGRQFRDAHQYTQPAHCPECDHDGASYIGYPGP